MLDFIIKIFCSSIASYIVPLYAISKKITVTVVKRCLSYNNTMVSFKNSIYKSGCGINHYINFTEVVS